MNSQEIYKLASELTAQQIKNVSAYWENAKQDKLDTFKRLVRSGDSEALAMATVMLNNLPDNSDLYRKAYEA